ncbi:MAG: VWA domain-containing protein [Chlorobiota bacterium]|nr:MAG: VWA domain-containing protein [Chlorobiota bacterium]
MGQGTASFVDNQNVLWDERPSTGVSAYGTPTITTSGTTGTFDCSVSGTSNRDIVCEANGAATMPPGSYIDIAYTVTPSATGTLSNPRNGESCSADDGGVISESNEGNNNCANSVTVATYTVTPNPSLGQACGLDIALIVDNSTSISESELNTMKSAMTAFTSAFAGTPTEFSVSRFATTATVLQGFTANLTDVNNAINDETFQRIKVFSKIKAAIHTINSYSLRK